MAYKKRRGTGSSKSSTVIVRPTDVLLAATPSPDVQPPVRTHAQELPFAQLTWENFERFCHRLASRDVSAEYWQRYGRQGQAQGGIDILVRRRDGRYDLWQCKRFTTFSARGIKSAADAFLLGAWVSKAAHLKLCVSASTADIKIQDEIEKQAARLAKRDVVLEVFGSDHLSEIAKKLPHLVDDFFGRAWLKDFCGENAESELRTRGHVLDVNDSFRLRSELYEFYKVLFQSLDRGLVVSTNPTSPMVGAELRERIVVPDILVDSPDVGRPRIKSAPDQKATSSEVTGDRTVSGAHQIDAVDSDLSSTSRRTFARWIGEGDQLALLGEAGSGKSTLLRYLALDLLSTGPKLLEAALKWGQHLPILIPFSRWTDLVAKAGTTAVPLTKMMDTWLESFSASPALRELVAKALEDRRLLLLVDGLDEWSNQAAAGTTFNILQVTILKGGIAAVATGRPQGANQLGVLGHPWKVARLAPLNDAQQLQVAAFWFERMLPLSKKPLPVDVHHRHTQWEVEQFFRDLRAGGHLNGLAGTPLLLTGLISLRLRQVSLPRDRFAAYKELLKLLLEVHPRARATAAADTAPRFQILRTPELQTNTLARLAYEIRSGGTTNRIGKDEAYRLIVSHLRTDSGLAGDQAAAGASELLSVNAETMGVLIEKSPNELGFVHAVFEEFLAAVHIEGWPLEQQKQFVAQQCSAQTWRNVILALLNRLVLSSDVDALIESMEAAPLAAGSDAFRRALIAEAVFGETRRSPHVARRIANQVFNTIESGAWMPERKAMLDIALMASTGSTALAGEVTSKIPTWFPETQWSRYEISGLSQRLR